MSTTSVDVLIVGAGPVGLTLAIECHRHGVGFRIIDKNPVPTDKSKALAVWSGNIECLAAMGVVDRFLANSMPLRRARFADHGKLISEVSCCEDVDSVFPVPFLLPQSETERLLIEYLRELGVEVERNVELAAFDDHKGGVRCALQHADGRQETVEAQWLAGCDGARSVVRKSLGVEFKGETEQLGFLLIDAKIEGDLPEDAILACWGDEFTTIFFPVKPGVFRMFTQRKDLSNRENPTLEEMQAYIDHTGLGGRIKMYDPEWLSFFTVNERVAERMRVGRVFLLGDAAHIHSPAGGQGMNTGMQDAFNLGWKLAQLKAGRGDAEAIAESYHAERHPVAEEVIAMTSRLLDVGLSNSFLLRVAKGFAFTILKQAPALQKLLSGKLSEVHVRYKESPLVQNGAPWRGRGGFAAGERMRDYQLRDARTGTNVSLWAQLLGAKHTLILFSGDHAEDEALQALAEVADAAGRYETEILTIGVWHGDRPPKHVSGIHWLLDPKGRAHERYGVKDAAYYLIRPDQYVAARAPINNVGPAESYLRRIRQGIELKQSQPAKNQAEYTA